VLAQIDPTKMRLLPQFCDDPVATAPGSDTRSRSVSSRY
jgi:hypothetical protein